MGHGHSHGGDADARVKVGETPRNILIGFLVVVAVIAVAGLIWLWPDGDRLRQITDIQADAPGVTYVDGTIQSVSDGCESGDSANQNLCQTAQVRLTNGDEAGRVVPVELQGSISQAGLRAGDSVELVRIPVLHDEPFYGYSGTNRMPVLWLLVGLFVVCVIAVARLRGALALVGLGIAAWVLLGFMLPALIVGRPGIPVALAGSTAIMFVVLYVAHGVSIRTSTALAGTLLGLAATTGLGWFAVNAARLSGLADETEYDLGKLIGGLNFQELLMCAIIIGGLGVLNDVTITQSSAVWELRAAGPHLSRRQIFASGMRIGRDHIASTIYTIVFAYAGGALAILMLLYFSKRQVVDLFGVELFAGEAVRTLASAIGLVLAVPITTGIAALTVGPARASGAPASREVAPDPAAS